jgi:hypothetical protein
LLQDYYKRFKLIVTFSIFGFLLATLHFDTVITNLPVFGRYPETLKRATKVFYRPIEEWYNFSIDLGTFDTPKSSVVCLGSYPLFKCFNCSIKLIYNNTTEEERVAISLLDFFSSNKLWLHCRFHGVGI